MKAARPRVLILDMDGCLVDSREGILESFRFAARQTMPGLDVDRANVRVGPPIRKMYQRAFPQLTDAGIEKLALAFRAHYDAVGLLKTTLFPGARELLAKCAEAAIDVHLATNKPSRAAQTILERLEVQSYFKSIVAVDSRQPPYSGKMELLAHLCELNRVHCPSALYVGDTEEDLLAANACGMPFVFASYGYGGNVEHPSVIASLSELLPLFEPEAGR